MRWWLAVALVAMLIPQAYAEEEKPVELSLGMKFGGGASVWTSPSNTTLYRPEGGGESFTMPLFHELRGGFNYSVGAFLQLRIVRYVGIETGLVLTRRQLREETAWTYTELVAGAPTTYTSRSKEHVTWGTIRVPLMFKFMVPIGDLSAFWLGAGPEFSIGKWADAEFELADGESLKGTRSDFKELHAVRRNDTYLVFGTGFLAGASEHMSIPIELRFGLNMSQPNNFLERVAFDRLPTKEDDSARPTQMTVKARDSFYVEIMVGVTYNLL